MGTGRHCSAWPAAGDRRSVLPDRDTVPVMPIAQGTVRHFDPDARVGSVLLDDGTEVPFSAAAFDAGGLRLLRPGQRVRFDRDATGAIQRITLLTLR